MSDFNLNELIASCGDAGPSPDDIAAKVEPLIPEAHRHAVFLMLLSRYIVSSKVRLTQVIAHPEAARMKPAPVDRSAPKPARSAKVAAYREHAKFLSLNVSVGRRERKYMKNCTYVDLMAAAETRRSQASANNVAADQYEALAALLKKHRAATVGDLPNGVLTEFLNSRRRAA